MSSKAMKSRRPWSRERVTLEPQLGAADQALSESGMTALVKAARSIIKRLILGTSVRFFVYTGIVSNSLALGLIALVPVICDAAPAGLVEQDLVLNNNCSLRIAVLGAGATASANSTSSPKGDVLFLHGFGDRLDNHGPLFREWSRRGFRVISFDLPSHGESSCDRLNLFTEKKILEIAALVEKTTRDSSSRPLLLAGWSMGGLLATRAAQTNVFKERPLKGVVLLAPQIALPGRIGGDGFIRSSTWTRSPRPPHEGEITPKSMHYTPIFAGHIANAATVAQTEPWPAGLPMLILVGGDREDLYVNTSQVKKWALAQKFAGKSMMTAQCAGAFHELDNEPDPVGTSVRSASADFLSSLVDGRTPEPPGKGCTGF